MFSSIHEFEYVWSQEIEATQKILKHITDKSLSQQVTPEGRTLGRIAWHLTTTIPEMMSRTGLTFGGPGPDDPVPSSAKAIFKAYNDFAISLMEQIKSQWTDASLQVMDDMYGEKWTRAQTLSSLVFHQIHHRGQMSVLMRQAGLSVPGIYGPSREEWANYGMSPPVV